MAVQSVPIAVPPMASSDILVSHDPRAARHATVTRHLDKGVLQMSN